MSVFVLTPALGDQPDRPASLQRSMVSALAEFALRGGFAPDLQAFWPLERLAEVPPDDVAWILAPLDDARDALSSLSPPDTPSPDSRPALLITPLHEFWQNPIEATPPFVDPRAPLPSTTRPFGPRSWSEPIDWLGLFWSLLQRAEEYAPSAPVDSHGRFPSWSSLLVRENLIDRPVADEMARRIARRLRLLGRPLSDGAAPSEPEPIRLSSWTLALTHDIDSIRFWNWRRLGVGVLRRPPEETLVAKASLGPEAEDSFLKDVPRFLKRVVAAPWFRTLRSTAYPQRDPHWSFPWLRQWENGRRVRPTLFVIPERRTNLEPYDLSRGEGTRGSSGKLVTQLRRWAEDGAEIGLHPPYDAMDYPGRLGEQRLRLEGFLAGGTVRSARFHWLRFRVPAGWMDLAQGGLVNDATLGHAQCEGFRAGTCHPFAAVDLRSGADTGVIEVPLAAMDTTLRFHRQLTPGQAFSRLYHLLRACRRAGGVFNLLWHTNSFDRYEWKGWWRVFVRVVEESLEQGAVPRTISEIADTHRSLRAEVLQRILPDEPNVELQVTRDE